MINLYTNNPTAAGKDGSLISQEMTQTSPLSMTVKAGESKACKVGIRCDTGYKTTGKTTLSFAYWDGTEYKETGGNIGKWYFAPDDNYTSEEAALANASWVQNSIDITDVIGDTNKIIWVKVATTASDTPMTDNTVSICVKATIEAA